MGNDIVLDVRKQSYLFGNKNLGLGFDSPRLHHIEYWKQSDLGKGVPKTGDFDFTFPCSGWVAASPRILLATPVCCHS